MIFILYIIGWLTTSCLSWMIDEIKPPRIHSEKQRLIWIFAGSSVVWWLTPFIFAAVFIVEVIKDRRKNRK